MKKLIAIGLVTLEVAANVWAQGTTRYTVFPIGFSSQNGDDGDLTFQVPTERQQMLRASYLAQSWDSPVLITAIAFRLNNDISSYNTVIPRVEIRFSTTSRAPENLSDSWSSNIGSDARVVFNQSNVPLAAAGGAGPNPFELRFEIGEPFYYDPQAGNLVMFIGTYGTGEFFGGRQIDAHTFDPPLSSSPIVGRGGQYPDPYPIALVTQFEWVAIPEPGTMSLLFIGGLIALTIRRKPK